MLVIMKVIVVNVIRDIEVVLIFIVDKSRPIVLNSLPIATTLQTWIAWQVDAWSTFDDAAAFHQGFGPVKSHDGRCRRQ